MCIAEVVKIIIEAISSSSIGVPYTVASRLPFWLCSLALYVTPIWLFAKKESVREAAAALMCTSFVFGGLINFIYPTILQGDYPVFSFMGLHSMLYHFLMAAIGIWMLSTKIHTLKWRHAWRGFLLFLVFAIPIVILDYLLNWNYAFFRGGPSLVGLITDPINAIPFVGHILVSLFELVVVSGIVGMGIFYLPSICHACITKLKTKSKMTKQ
jgi:uncharacterized membrane protein YwaF